MGQSYLMDIGQFFDRKKLNLIKKWWIDIDRVSFSLIIFIIVLGLIMGVISTPYVAQKISVSQFFFIKKHLVFALIAIVLVVLVSMLNVQQIKLLSIFGTGLFVVLLVVVALFGSEVKGAKRWITISGFNLQPSEFVKTFFLVFNAFLLNKFYYKRWHIKYGVSALSFSIIALLIIIQPDFGMTMILTLLWLAQLFIFGLPMVLITLISLLLVVGSIFAYLALPHVADRINRFFDVDQKNYQVERSIDAYVNGGLFGVGPGNGIVKKHIPDAHTDFIFAVIAEEFGIISCLAIIFIFFVIVTRTIKRVMDEDDLFSYLATIGLILQFVSQMIINIGVSLGLMPTKGMTLPFISYGGSSIIAMSLCFGMILSLTKKKYHNKIDSKNITLI